MRILTVIVSMWFLMCFSKSEAQCVVTIIGNTTVCAGQSMMLIARTTGGNPTNFVWASTPAGSYPNNDTIIVTPTTNTSYAVQVSGNGCNSTDQLVVAILPLPPTPSFTFGPDNVCSGTPISFSGSPTGSGLRYSWDFGDGRTDTGANVTHKFYSYGNGTGTFSVRLTIRGANGCTRSITQTVIVKQRPHAVLTPAIGTDTLTFDGFVTFYKCITNQQTSAVFTFRNFSVPSTGINYYISWGDTGAPFTSSAPWSTVNHTYGLGIYTITVIASDPVTGCSDTSTYKAFFGSNPAGGIATLGSTTICGPAPLSFILTNYQSNPPGTLYTVSFNDSTGALTFQHPPPDTITHLFDRTSCGTTSSNGSNFFGNAYAAYLIVTNPCGITSGSVLPIYVSMPPKANFNVSNNFTACVNTTAIITNTSINGQAVSNGNCNSTTYLLWNITPSTGWNVTSGNMGSDNGLVGPAYDPSGWTTGTGNLNVRFTTAGTYQVRLVAANNCGKPDTIIKSVCVSGPPSPSFTLPTNISCAPFTLSPTNTTPATNCGAIMWDWNIVQASSSCPPDSSSNLRFVGSTSSNSNSPQIRFYNQGIYNLSLTAQNACGSFATPTQTITVKDKPEASVNIPAGICGGDTFSASSSALACASTVSGYSWTFQGGTPATSSSQNPGSISITTPGVHTVSLSVTSECGVTTVDTSIAVDTIPVANPGVDTFMCSGSQVRIGAAQQPGYNYAWTPSFGLNDTTLPSPTVFLTNNTDSIITQTYFLTAGITGCTDTASVVVSVYPPAIVQPGGPYNVCAGDSVVLTGTVSGGASSVTWSSSNGTFNPTDSLVTTFAPSITSGFANVTIASDDPAGPCPAASANAFVTVNQLPLVTNNPLAQTVCSGVPSQAIRLTSNFFGTTFSWTASSPNGVTGFQTSGTTDSIPSQTFTNSTSGNGTVVFVITPSLNGCPGTPVNYAVTVTPVPDVVLPAPQIICSGSSFNTAVLSSNTTGTTYTWTSLADSGMTGNTLSGSGDITGQTLFNSTTDTASVVYTVTPSNGCPGTPADYRVTVNPVPIVLFNPAPQTICSGETSQLVNLSSPTPGVSIQWTANIPNGISQDSVGTFTIPAQTLINSTNSQLTITYSAQATTTVGASCPGTNATYTITVIPIPEIDFTLSVNSGCTPLQVTFEPVIQKFGIPDSLIFSWDDGSANYVLYPNMNQPIWNTARHTFYNNTSSPDTFWVALTARNQCIDTSVIKPVILAPNLINANFTATPTTGCEPLSVTLQDRSTGAASLSWCFDFNLNSGTCSGSGAVNNPGATFQQTFSSGTYVIALYVTNGFGCARDTAFQTIHVSPAPVADFSASMNLCAEVPINFTDLSFSSGASFVSAYRWQFGDGDSSQVKNPVHTYPVGGTYPVCLEVTSSFGCVDSICKPVTVLTKPVVDFNYFDTCFNTQPIAFTSQSTGATFFDWDFADGNTSSVADPVHSFPSSGNYNVRLIGSTATCSDTAFHTVRVYPIPNAAFTLPIDYGCGTPFSLGMNNTSSGANGYSWDFGNNTSSMLTNPTATYSANGPYTITLTTFNSFGCFDSAQATLDIYPFPVILSVDIQPSSGCQPVNAVFTVNATNANQFEWNFGDGTSVTNTSPTVSHLYNDTGSYSVLIKAYSFNDCGDTAWMQDTIHVFIIPTAAFIYDMNDNVEPYNGTVVFTNQSLNASGYFWDFGDGTSSSEISPSHLFPEINQFDVVLVATSSNGCSDTVTKSLEIIKKSLYVPNVMAPDFSAGNGLVKMWMPTGAGLKDYHAQIFNRWGELLWESRALTADHAPAEGWNGSYQGKTCQQDAYVWKIEAVFLDGTRWQGMSHEKGGPRKTIGSVTLVR